MKSARYGVAVLSLAVASAACLMARRAKAAVLLNDSFADGDRTNANLPTDSPDYVGISSGSGGTLTASAGKLTMVQGTSSQKLWTYFTSDNSTPNGSQPHNSVTQLQPGSVLTASMTFTMPNAITNSATTPGRDFRFGVFFDPTDARVQSDVNSDGGGSTSPWQDATGYAVQIPLNSNPSATAGAFALVKRTVSNTSLLGSSGAFTAATSGGSPFVASSNVSYTVQLMLSEASASEMDVTASILQGSTVLSTQTIADLGTTFGTASVAAGGLSGSQGIYTNFDHFFLRMGSNTETTEFDFSNFSVTVTSAAAPEPGTIGVMGGVLVLLGRRARLKGAMCCVNGSRGRKRG